MHAAYDEDRYLGNMVFMTLGLFVLPALLAIAYLIFNHAAFQPESIVR